VRNSLAWKSFQATLGASLALVVLVAGVAGVGLGVALIHDFIVTGTYEPSPKYDRDNAWGPFWVSIDSKNTAKEQPVAARTESCYEPGWPLGRQAFWKGYPLDGADTTNPNCKVTLPPVPGSAEATAKLRVRNRLWLRSSKFHGAMILAKFGDKTTSVNGNCSGLCWGW